MIRNFFATALRNIVKYRVYSFINFLGLTIGFALALLIFAYVRSEFSYDRFHEKADRLYRISYHTPNDLKLASTPPPIAPVMKDFFPEVEEVARMYGRNVSVKRPDAQESFEETNVFFADSALAKMFSFEVLQGDIMRALTEKFSVVITDEMAKKYFGEASALGEVLLFQGNQSFKVAAVVKEYPEHSHLRFNMLVPFENMYDLETAQSAQLLRNNLAVNFVISHSYTYVLLKPGTHAAAVDQRMPDFLKKYANPNVLVGQVFTLMPLTDIHLHSDLLAEPTNPNDITNIYIFIAVGILTLLIASINYVNLSTAQSFTRIKEIAVRKVMGAMKTQLISQFLAESFLFCLLSVLLAFALFYTTLPVLNQLTNKSLVFAEVADGALLTICAVLVIAITLLAGGYPAYFVTKFNSIHAIKGEGVTQHGSQFLRRTLVVFQLAIACMLLSGSLLIVKQLDFLSNRPLGFQKEHIINVPLFSQNLNGIFRQNDSTFWNRLQTFRDAIEAQTVVNGTTLSSIAPGLGGVFRGAIPEGFSQEDNLFVASMSVDYDFLNAYGIALVSGRTFAKEFGTDVTEAFIVNETAVKEWNWGSAEKALGKSINREGKQGKVIGVVKDFNFTSLVSAVSPMIIDISPNQFSTLSIKFENANVQSTLDQLEKDWNNIFPEKAFEFTFLDEQLNNQYQGYEDFSAIIQSFALIAVIISCLGVYGLVMFVVQRKVKEIGVRKVLGASVGSILQLIYKDFAWLVALGFVVGIPVSYYLIKKWLENFDYHTNIDVTTYMVSLFLVLLVVSLTIGYQAVRASLANPVKSLRSE